VSFCLPPIPDAFARVAWAKISSEIEASSSVKTALQLEVIRHHQRSSHQRDFVRSAAAVLHKQSWTWPRGHKLLSERLGDEPDVEELLEALYQWFTTATHQLYRRGQIRALLAAGKGHVIRVSANPETGEHTPCGAVDGAVYPVTENLLRRMPPCSHPFCCCSWAAAHPDSI